MPDSFLKGLGALSLARVAGQVVTWCVTLYALRVLGPRDYALVAMTGSVTALMGMIAEFGFGASLIQSKALEARVVSAVFSLSLMVSAGLVMLSFPLGLAVSRFYEADDLAHLIPGASLQLLAGSLLMPAVSHINHRGAYTRLAILEIISAFVGAATAFFLVAGGYGAAAIVFGPVIGFYAKAILANSIEGTWMWPGRHLAEALPHLRFGGMLLGSNILAYSASQSFVLIGGRLLEKQELGFFFVALELAMLPLSKTMGVLNQVLYPELARRKRGGADTRKLFLQGFRALSLLLMPVFFLTAFAADIWVPVLLGEKWLPAVWPIRIASVGAALQMIGSLHSTYLLGLGLVRYRLFHFCALNVFTLAGIFAIGIQGAVGMSLAFALGVAATLLLSLAGSRKTMGYGPVAILGSLRPSLVPAMFAGLLTYVASTFLADLALPPLLVLVLVCLLMALTYFILARAIFSVRFRKMLDLTENP